MSRQLVERAHALTSQILTNETNKTVVDIPAVRRVLAGIKLALEQALELTSIPEPRDALRPKNAPPPVVESMFTFEASDFAVSGEEDKDAS